MTRAEAEEFSRLVNGTDFALERRMNQRERDQKNQSARGNR
jgi:hypothetical protein